MRLEMVEQAVQGLFQGFFHNAPSVKQTESAL